ncbi:MAG: single-stranded DNA-binding protein [Bacteroidaceae bacterium]|nr:single-stranded DNA-binding protein [Bacteroidaceae bacterium]
MNKAILIGNVGRDPNVRYFEGGRAVAQVTLATTERGYTLQNGTVVPDRTEWHNLVFRNGLAQTVEKYVHKGDKLYVEGKIFTRTYDDQSGIKRYVTEVYVDEMEMLTPKTNQSAPTAPQPAAPTAQPIAPTQEVAESAKDLPF